VPRYANFDLIVTPSESLSVLLMDSSIRNEGTRDAEEPEGSNEPKGWGARRFQTMTGVVR